MKYKNPIISGFNPDPSICRVGDDYYIVTSTFEFFPGVPVYHSKDLINWELISHCLSSDSQSNLIGARASGGIYAPTIRYNNGKYYMTTTNVSHGGNFIVHASNPKGPWSEPKWVDQDGIDPSLLFDDDGLIYYTSTNSSGISLSVVNPDTGERLSETKIISNGSGGKYPEAPHLYKINGMYYLMIAEGGTEYGHMETIFRSGSPWGPYEACPHNPILTHRNVQESNIQCTGHGDIVEDENGNWWMVCLGVRPIGVLLHNLGRETFLVPVVWDENGWPHVGKNGCLNAVMDGPLPKNGVQEQKNNWRDDFDYNNLDLNWNFVRSNKDTKIDLQEKHGWLKISGSKNTLSSQDEGCPSFIGIRQKHFKCNFITELCIDENDDNGECGISAYYNHSYHYEIFLRRRNGNNEIVVRKQIHDIEAEVASVPVGIVNNIKFKIASDRNNYYFEYSLENNEWINLSSGLVAGLCTEGTYMMTFTGVYLGLYACNCSAYFNWVEYNGIEE